MLKGLTLTEMAAKLQAQSEAKQDFVIPSPSLKMIIDGCLLTLCALWIAVETDAGYRWLDKE